MITLRDADRSRTITCTERCLNAANPRFDALRVSLPRSLKLETVTTVSGGSLGSCVDEERSHLR